MEGVRMNAALWKKAAKKWRREALEWKRARDAWRDQSHGYERSYVKLSESIHAAEMVRSKGPWSIEMPEPIVHDKGDSVMIDIETPICHHLTVVEHGTRIKIELTKDGQGLDIRVIPKDGPDLDQPGIRTYPWGYPMGDEDEA
jgi:hypothetical protein